MYQNPEPRASRKQFVGPVFALDLDRVNDNRMGAQTQMDYSNPYAKPIQTERLRTANKNGKKRLDHLGMGILSQDPQRRNREERNRLNAVKKYY